MKLEFDDAVVQRVAETKLIQHPYEINEVLSAAVEEGAIIKVTEKSEIMWEDGDVPGEIKTGCYALIFLKR